MYRKPIVIGVIALAVIVVAAGVYFGTQTLVPRTLVALQFAEPFPSPEYHLPFVVGVEKGIFQKYGLEVESVIFKGGAEQSQAIAAGQVKMGFVAPTRAPDLKAAGVPLKIIGNLLPRTSFAVVVPKDSPIKSVQEMNGQNFGVSNLRGLSASLSEATNDYYKMKMKLVAVGEAANGIALLQRGEVKGYINSVCTLAPFLAKGDVKIIAEIASIVPKPWTDQVIVAHEDLLKEKPEAVKNFMKALDESIRYMMSNRDYTIGLDMKLYERERKVSEACFSAFSYEPGLKVNVEGLKNTMDFFVQYRTIERGRANLALEMIDTQFT